MKHFRWFASHISEDRIDASSAHVSFFFLISFVPFLALVLTVMDRIHFSDGITMIDAIISLFPQPVSEYLHDLMPTALPPVSGLVPVAVITAIWSSSVGMVAVMKGFNRVFRVKKTRNFVLRRVFAMIYVVLFLVVLVLTAVLLVFGSSVYRFLLEHSAPFFTSLLMNFRSLVGFILLLVLFLLIYLGIPRERVRFLNALAGATFSAAGWLLFSFVFSLFVSYFSDFSIYGGLATLVVFMFWLFFCMYIMFLGGEVSMWLQTSGIYGDIRELWRKYKKKLARKRAKKIS